MIISPRFIKHLKRGLLFSLLGILILFCGCGKSTIQTIKLSLILGENSDWYKGAAKWKELVEAKSNHRIEIKIFPNASLSNNNQRTELEMVQSGVLDASLESTITLSNLDPKFTVLSLPWLFPNYEKAFMVTDGPAGQKLLNVLPEKNMVGLAFGVNGFRQITNNKRDIHKPADLKGLKIRVPLIKMYIDLFKLCGADPSSMNFGELMNALSTGVMDGQENPVSVILTAKLYEVQKYITLWNYSFDPIILCMNKTAFDKFSPGDQKILKDTALEAFVYQRNRSIENEKKAIDELKTKGMHISVLTHDESKNFKNITLPLYTQYRDSIGAELMETVLTEAKK